MGTSDFVTAAPPELFDRTARALRRDRTATLPEAFFTGLIIDELLDRLATVKRGFGTALVIGAEPRLVASVTALGIAVQVVDPSGLRASRFGGLAVEEDRLPFAAESFDLVLVAGLLDTVADLPGALVLIRRALKPDGLFLGCMAAAPSLPSARAAIAAADAVGGASVARLHPQVDVASAGDLLVRAGFALSVADLDSFDLSYRSFGGLIDDLRAAAATNVLAQRHGVTRAWLAAASAAFMARAEANGRVRETVSIVTLTGWAPSPDQPRPAARGSGTTSLAAALTRRD
ncbi:methyltransferase domain-containing protein [Sphingomonas sp.]|uniref:methyltransferase domain-containing protein n=1 Tax=Sphingomonas sp. TaxID=28214 RepID=UPI0025D4B067|nr:methyltransferase domain-containing protein [Sphingomonas sp.]